ncbi:MAG: hypothetical protein AAGF15_02025 [Pseudomonadota bacterium]
MRRRPAPSSHFEAAIPALLALADHVLEEWEASLFDELSMAFGRLKPVIDQHAGGAAVGYLLYGSCLRDGVIKDRVIDLYVIVSALDGPARRAVPPGMQNAFLPHVFLLSTPLAEGAEETAVRAKVNLITLTDLKHMVTREAPDRSIWARLAQPTALAWAKSDDDRRDLAIIIARAIQSFVTSTTEISDHHAGSTGFWTDGFRESFRAELRSERTGRPDEIVMRDELRYRMVGAAWQKHASLTLSRRAATVSRTIARWRGKLRHIGRLLKSAKTTQGGGEGGIEYLAWKISRHSGTPVRLNDWQRRHPLVAGIWLALTLRLRGAFR